MAHTGNTQNSKEIFELLTLCADQGWRVNFYKKDGSSMVGGFITATDPDKGAFLAERMGERHIKPTLFFVEDLERVEADWSGK